MKEITARDLFEISDKVFTIQGAIDAILRQCLLAAHAGYIYYDASRIFSNFRKYGDRKPIIDELEGLGFDVEETCNDKHVFIYWDRGRI